MAKIRIIPTVLTNGITVVKGKNFNNWRTVGNAEAIASLYAKRDVDELMFLDVEARNLGQRISLELVSTFSDVLNIPFSVGGGINSIEEVGEYFRRGAEKVVLGTAAVENQLLIKETAQKYGSQAVVVSIDIESVNSRKVCTNSGNKKVDTSLEEFISQISSAGAGELLLQNLELEGEMKGYDLDLITSIRSMTDLPIIASSGCGNALDAKRAIDSGANALGVGSLFHFTETTPKSLAKELKSLGVDLRNP
jgi:cyclase